MRILLLGLFLSSTAGAAELRTVVVEREGAVYSLHSEVWFDAELAELYAVFLDYDLRQEFTSYVVESRNVDTDHNGGRGFYVRNHGCVWFVCRSFVRTGNLEHETNQYIRATADAELSDFHSSFESWDFAADGAGTLVVYKFRFEPKFWLPPLIGPYALQRKLEKNSAAALDRIEAAAQDAEAAQVEKGSP